MRRLATGAAAFSLAVFAANYVLSYSCLIWCAAAIAALGLGLAFAKRRWLILPEIALISCALGLAVFALYSAHTALPASALSGQTRHIEGMLLDYPEEYDDYCRVTLRLSGDMPRLRALVYDDEKALSGLRPGDVVSMEAYLKSADTRYGEDYDHYNARGIYLLAYSRADVAHIGSGFSAAAAAARLKHALSARISALFPADCAAFMRSVMLGDKGGLYDDTSMYLALTRSGFMHVAAVSGMHVAFLVSLIMLFFGRTRRSALFCIALVWGFVAVTGGAPSAVRAGFMQSFLLLAPVLRRENDPPTSLAAALAVILAVNPHAAAGVGLQLSFGAVAGLILFSGRFNMLLCQLVRSDRALRVLKYPLGIIASSLAVMVFTVPLTALHFGYVAVLSPLMNVAALWAVSACFCGGFIACALSLISSALGIWAAWLAAWPARYIILAARTISRVPFALVYLNNGLGLGWLALTYAAAVLAAFTRASARFKVLAPTALSVGALLLMLAFVRMDYRRAPGVFTALDVGQGQCICAMSGDETILVDCGGGASLRRAGEVAASYLLSCGRDGVDALILTHLHADHANGVVQLMEALPVARIYMPDAPNDDDGLLAPILAAAVRHGVEVSYISADSALTFGGMEVRLFAPPEGARDTNESGLMCRVSVGAYDMLITGDASIAAEDELAARHDLASTELLIVGHHGSKYSTGEALLKALDGETAIISVGYNSYGHPTNQTLERLRLYGYNVFRTDLNGSVEIRIG